MNSVFPIYYGDKRLPQRFWDKVSPEPNSGCWLWLAASSRGYGVLVGGDGRFLAHRLAFSRLVTPVNDPKVFVLHKCDTPPCVNPQHLFLGDQLANMRDMSAKRRYVANNANMRKTHCHKGHPLFGPTVRVDKRGHRFCKTCFNEYQRAWRAERAKI